MSISICSQEYVFGVYFLICGQQMPIAEDAHWRETISQSKDANYCTYLYLCMDLKENVYG